MLNTNQANPVPGDPTGDLAVAANARLALAVNYLAGAPDSVVTPLRLALERDTRAVDPLCV